MKGITQTSLGSYQTVSPNWIYLRFSPRFSLSVSCRAWFRLFSPHHFIPHPFTSLPMLSRFASADWLTDQSNNSMNGWMSMNEPHSTS